MRATKCRQQEAQQLNQKGKEEVGREKRVCNTKVFFELRKGSSIPVEVQRNKIGKITEFNIKFSDFAAVVCASQEPDGAATNTCLVRPLSFSNYKGKRERRVGHRKWKVKKLQQDRRSKLCTRRTRKEQFKNTVRWQRGDTMKLGDLRDGEDES
ncbi:hypothetical protein RUM44_004066 [Polyplax serrata]|uniref:Uncharacterized protein n=1 Tax=Polyplax serrata TaxID=468196 RepID=A0ABR1B1S3_POLSC